MGIEDEPAFLFRFLRRDVSEGWDSCSLEEPDSIGETIRRAIDNLYDSGIDDCLGARHAGRESAMKLGPVDGDSMPSRIQDCVELGMDGPGTRLGRIADALEAVGQLTRRAGIPG